MERTESLEVSQEDKLSTIHTYLYNKYVVSGEPNNNEETSKKKAEKISDKSGEGVKTSTKTEAYLVNEPEENKSLKEQGPVSVNLKEQKGEKREEENGTTEKKGRSPILISFMSQKEEKKKEEKEEEKEEEKRELKEEEKEEENEEENEEETEEEREEEREEKEEKEKEKEKEEEKQEEKEEEMEEEKHEEKHEEKEEEKEEAKEEERKDEKEEEQEEEEEKETKEEEEKKTKEESEEESEEKSEEGSEENKEEEKDDNTERKKIVDINPTIAKTKIIENCFETESGTELFIPKKEEGSFTNEKNLKPRKKEQKTNTQDILFFKIFKWK